MKTKLIIAGLALLMIAAFRPVLSEDVQMGSLTAGDSVLVSNDGELFFDATFSSLCYVPSATGLESLALIDFPDKTQSGHYLGTYTADMQNVVSEKLLIGAMCSESGQREYLVAKTQLLGLLTQLSNVFTASDDTAKATRSFADLYTRKAEVLTEIAEIRRIILD